MSARALFAALWLPLALAHLANTTLPEAEAEAEGCTIELQCAECVPEHMPEVRAPAATADGVITLPHGGALELACGGGRFLAYPLSGALAARCERGRYRVPADGALRPLLDLGCQESVYEDVLHQVEHCAPPLQGRSYQMRSGTGRAVRLAAVCYDADRGVIVRAEVAPAAAAGADVAAGAPLSLLGNFEQMFDASTRRAAERLYGDEAALERHLRELYRYADYEFAGQRLVGAAVVAPSWLPAAHWAGAGAASNRVAAWHSVAAGNLRHLQRDVAALVARARARGAELRVWAGTHGVLAPAGAPLYLREGRRFPVPRYLWAAVVEGAAARGTALVLLNDPFVPVSDIRAAVFCESACATLPWLARLRRHARWERPLLGLVFCCRLHEFAAKVLEMPPIFNASFTHYV